MPNPGDVVTISGCPCCSSSSSSSSSSGSSSSSSDVPACAYCGMWNTFTFTISGVSWVLFPGPVVMTQCDAMNGTFTLTRLVVAGGTICQWKYSYIGSFGASCHINWLLTVSAGTGGSFIWYLNLQLSGSCGGNNVGWDGYCTTYGCGPPITFTGQQCAFAVCPTCFAGSSGKTATFPTTITMTVA